MNHIDIETQAGLYSMNLTGTLAVQLIRHTANIDLVEPNNRFARENARTAGEEESISVLKR